MKGKWEVTAQFIADTQMYAVYRLRDVDAVDHSGNREYAGGYVTDRAEAEFVAERLNAEDEEKGPESGNPQDQKTKNITSIIGYNEAFDNGE
ncbi:hypothetical protein INP51_13240 [Blautia liquoris]|uniref:Uncharacterized protein n=1 Tax=Blautia liquoris TaxID=2779518 RepID=A0A7M2RFB0_9FIRM|nr:hypothetical protein [Blautia liquoris]QOV18939.1 hypothetical protein INP51_13240 [Blautia liquoris]